MFVSGGCSLIENARIPEDHATCLAVNMYIIKTSMNYACVKHITFTILQLEVQGLCESVVYCFSEALVVALQMETFNEG